MPETTVNPFVPKAERAADALLDLLGFLSDDERVFVLSKFTDVFCEHCGRPYGEPGRCHCNNDE